MKAILVIDDMPKTCGGCPCMRVSITGFVCQKEWRDVVDPDHIPSWCPLKPMPTYDWHEEGKENECEEWYKNGWNDCIDAIIGGTKGEK